jgi:hypothetical protein
MSRIRIVHTTTYRYANPVAFGIRRLVCDRGGTHDVQVENSRSNLSLRRGELASRYLRNSIALATFLNPRTSLNFSDATVFRRDHHSHRRLLDVLPVRLPVQYSSLEGPIAQGYSRIGIPEETARLRDWTMQTFSPKQGDDAVHPLMRSIAGSIIQSAIGAARTWRRPRWKLQTPIRFCRTWPHCFLKSCEP